MMTTIDPPVFSIITVTKNNLSGLQATAASIQAQSFNNYQWIVIDGNSSDGTQDYMATAPALFLSEEDNGIYDAMNKGIDRADGHYIIFLNAGDIFSDPDILSGMAKAIGAEEPDFLYGDALETGGFYKKARDHGTLAQGMFTHHQAMVYKRDSIGVLRYEASLEIASDYGFTARFLKNARIVHYMPCALCIFENGGVSQRRKRLGRVEQFKIRKDLQLCSTTKNILIYTMQTMTAALRDYFPWLYFHLRAL